MHYFYLELIQLAGKWDRNATWDIITYFSIIDTFHNTTTSDVLKLRYIKLMLVVRYVAGYFLRKEAYCIVLTIRTKRSHHHPRLSLLLV